MACLKVTPTPCLPADRPTFTTDHCVQGHVRWPTLHACLLTGPHSPLITACRVM